MSNPFDDAAAKAASGGKYITEEGPHPAMVGKVDDGTFPKSGAPFADVVFMDVNGRTIQEAVWYDGDRDNGLWKIADLYVKARAEVPQPGEWDDSDRKRINLDALRRLEGCVLEIVCEKGEANSDGKRYNEVRYHNFYDGPPLEFPTFTEHGGGSASSGSGPGLFEPTAGAASQTDEDIPF